MTVQDTTEHAKLRAKRLRTALSEHGLAVGHGQALDLLARAEGLHDWNALAARLSPLPRLGPVPRGWRVAGDRETRYDWGQDPAGGPDGGPCATIRRRLDAAPEGGFATLMQSVDAAAWRGRRVALAGRLRAEGVAGALTLWLRADAAEPGRTLAFDNLEDKPDGPVSGTTGWETRRVVLDIPEGAARLAFGFYLRGPGQGWCAGLDLRAAPDLPVTAGPVGDPSPSPRNMGFEQGPPALQSDGDE